MYLLVIMLATRVVKAGNFGGHEVAPSNPSANKRPLLPLNWFVYTGRASTGGTCLGATHF